ncbi:hypothetical protein MTP99_011279 [Tenebrio molitor]|nr:hypothetical protein MTP99_011279 [Tenebrio molitor]
MAKRLTEEMVIARTKISDLGKIKRLNCWGSELVDVSLLRKMPSVEVLSLRNGDKMELLKDNKTQGGLAHLLQKKIYNMLLNRLRNSPFMTAVEASCKAKCQLVATIKHQPLPHESEARGPSKTKLESAADLVIPAKNHRWVLRIRASVTDLLSDPTLVAQLRSVESLHSKNLLESPIGFIVDIWAELHNHFISNNISLVTCN